MPRLSAAEIEALKARLDPHTYAIAFEEGTEHATWQLGKDVFDQHFSAEAAEHE